MRKHLFRILFAVLVLIPSALHAQIRIGPVVGLNMSNWVGKDVGNNEYKAGIHGGLEIEIKLHNKLGLKPGFLYSMKGLRARHNGGVRTNANYLDIPFILNYYTKENLQGLQIGAGPYFGILLSAKAKQEYRTDDVRNDMNGFDTGIQFGFGYKMKSGFGMALNYQWGLRHVLKHNRYINKAYNSTFQFSLHYLPWAK